MQLSTHYYPPTLEKKYSEDALEDCPWDSQRFGDFRAPNETHPEMVQEHLHRAWNRRGIIVSTGFQRSFFDLIFSNHAYCHGLVIRDINPQIIACAHFNILLLRIARDTIDYARLSSSEDNLVEIKGRVTRSFIPDKVQRFYLKHFFALASLYYRTSSAWKSHRDFQEVHYHQNPLQFQILQKYAREGNIIATLGTIEELEFLYRDEVVVVDTSNIQDYIMMDIRCRNRDEAPTMIWTRISLSYTEFYSRKFRPLSFLEREEMDQLLHLITATAMGRSWNKNVFASVFNTEDASPSIFATYSKETLGDVRAFVKEWLIRLPYIGWVNFSDTNAKFRRAEQINQLSEAECTQICRTPGIEKYVDQLVNHWGQLDPPIYHAFSEIPGWSAAFLRLCESQRNNPDFIRRFADFPLFQLFQRCG